MAAELTAAPMAAFVDSLVSSDPGLGDEHEREVGGLWLNSFTCLATAQTTW